MSEPMTATRKAKPPDWPTVPMDASADPDVLYGCRFTLTQVAALAKGEVPEEVRMFFQRYLDLFTHP